MQKGWSAFSSRGLAYKRLDVAVKYKMSVVNFLILSSVTTAYRVIICFLSFFLLFTGGATAGGRALRKASLIPHWVPQAQFAGYYVAREQGIYKKHGIDLTIIPGGPERQPSDLLKSRKADFATMWLCSGIQMRAEGTRVVNIAQMMPRSALMLVAKKSSGIKTPRDMNGKKIGLWGPIFQIQPRAFFKKYNLDVKVVRQSYSVNLFLRDGVDVASAMWYNEYHTILNSGLNPDELVTFFFYEHGLNFPEDSIYTLQDTFNRDPQLCKAFVIASIEGWHYAFAHPELALDIVLENLKREHIPARRVHQKWMLEKMKDLILPSDLRLPVGTLLPEDYHRVAETLKDTGLIKEIPEFISFYRKCSAYDEK
jgi:NitT/TauT family transport system substrate-binding protein